MKAIGPNISSVNQAAPGALESSNRVSHARGGASGAAFRDQLTALQNILPSTSMPHAVSAPLKFSNHAIDRMQARGIRFSQDEMAKIENAIGKAQAKGAKDTLLLTDSSALIVSVKDKTVVTVMDKAQLKDNVFTNIDSTVMI